MDFPPSAASQSVYLERRAARRPSRPLLSIVVPVYNEAEVLDIFLTETQAALAGLPAVSEFIFIDDGSSDDTARIICRYLSEGLPGKLIGLSRNFGKEAALTAGLDHAKGDILVILDADLQDPPGLIPEMLELWKQGYDVIYGLRVDRSQDTLMKRSTASMFYRLFDRLTNIHMPANAGDFRLIDRSVAESLGRLPERSRFMKGLFAWVGHPTTFLPYERPPRRAGEGKWNYWKLWNFALDGLASFTSVPLRVWLYCGGLIATAAFAYAMVLVARVILYRIDVPGYASLMVSVLFFSGLQLLSIGIIGEYIGRLFIETKQRPVYLVQDIIESSATPADANPSGGESA